MSSSSQAQPGHDIRVDGHRINFIFGYRLLPAPSERSPGEDLRSRLVHSCHHGKRALLRQLWRHAPSLCRRFRVAQATVADSDALSVSARAYGRWLESRTDGDLRQRLDSAREAASKKHALWRQIDAGTARNALHQDLAPAVDRILHGAGASKVHDFVRAAYNGDLPLQCERGALPGLFALALGVTAHARLKAQGIPPELVERLCVVPEAITLYRPASGIVLLNLGLRFVDGTNENTPLPLPLVEEALYALGHAADRGQALAPVCSEARPCLEDLERGELCVIDEGQKFGLRKATEAELATPASEGCLKPRRLARAVGRSTVRTPVLLETDMPPVSLQQLARALVGFDKTANANGALEAGPGNSGFGLIEELGPTDHGRIFTFSAVQCAAETPLEALPAAAYRLSRRFTTDYALAAEDVGGGAVRTFDNVVHAFATQGAAVVTRSGEPEFLKQFISTGATPTYLPLALVAYHEYLQLLHLTQDCAFIPNRSRPGEDHERANHLRYELAKFRLFFRFSHVSDIGHHNRIHRAWREALDLDRMLHELSLDVAEAGHVLAEERESQWKWTRAIAGAIGFFVATKEILEVILKLAYPDYEWFLVAFKADGRAWEDVESDPAYQAAMHFYHSAHSWEYVIFALAILAAILGARIAWKKGPQLEE